MLRPDKAIQGQITEFDPDVFSEELERYHAGVAVRGRLHMVQVEETGPYHIELRGYQFDAYLILRDDFGDVIAENDDGFVLSHAQLDIRELRSDMAYWLEACSVGGKAGAFELQLSGGAAPALTATERVQLEARETIRLVKATFGAETAATARELYEHAVAFRNRGLLAEAQLLLEGTLAINMKALGSEHPGIVTSLNNLGNVLSEQRLYAEARVVYERALRLQGKILGNEHPLVADSLDDFGLALKNEGFPVEARAAFERAFAIREKVLGSEHLEVADNLSKLGVFLTIQGLYADARPLHERALAIRENALGGEHPLVADSSGRLGALLQEQGLYTEALPLLERALAIREKVLGSDHPGLGGSLTDLGIALMNQGRYAEARALYERAIAVVETALGSEHIDLANSLNSLARLHVDQGLYAEAEPLYRRYLAISEKAHGSEHPNIATGLDNLGIVFVDQGLYAEAQPFHERALAIRQKVFRPEHPEVARSLFNLGLVLINQGFYAEGQPFYERALLIFEKALGSEHPEVASILNGLALLLVDQGKFAEARPVYERALAIRKKVLARDHPHVANSLNNLARLSMNSGDHESGWEFVRQEQFGKLAHLHAALASKSEQEGYLFLAKTIWQLEFLLSLGRTIADDNVAREAYEAVLRWKGQVARMLAASRSRGPRLSPRQEQLLEDLQVTQRQLSRLVSDTTLTPELRSERTDELVSARNELELRWQRSVTVEFGEPPSFEALRMSLPANSAYIDFFVHRIFLPSVFEGETLVTREDWSEPHLSVWISRPDSPAPVLLDLGPVARIQPQTRIFLEDLVSRRGVSTVGETNAARADLSGFPWHVLEPHLIEVDKLFISPDGFLGAFPFEALQFDDGTYLIERFAVVYVQGIEALRDSAGSDGVAPKLLSVGGVDFTQRDLATPQEHRAPSVASASGRVPEAVRGYMSSWANLPHTSYESRAVFDLHAGTFADPDSRILLQDSLPTEERLKREMPQHSILHLATHGYFQPEGTVSLWDEARRQHADEDNVAIRKKRQRRLLGHHPGLLSGLVCAGANMPASEGHDDGFLTAEEVGWLDLSGVDLVVLSACETGLGESRSGEGLIGLRRAFRTAGAGTVISALWQVDDRATSELMQGFYKNLWLKSMSKGEALRSAQLEMLRRNRSEHGGDGLPSTWGAFILSGDWR